MPRSSRKFAAIALAAAAITVLAGCSSPSHSSSSPSASSQSSAAGVAAAQAALTKAEAVPSYTAPGPAFDAAKAAGKHVFYIPQTSNVPFVVAVQKALSKVAATAHVDLTVWPTTGKSTEWVQGIETAISQKADAIILGASPDALAPQLAEAAAAKIPVIVLHQYDTSMTLPANVKAFAFAPFVPAAKLLADYAVASTKGSADVLVITSNELKPSPPMAAAVSAELTSTCPKCTDTEVNVAAADWGSKMQSSVQAALLRDPKINVVIPLFDSSSQFVTAAITAAGKADSVSIATFNNTPFVLDLMQKGSPVKMDVGESINWIGYAAMDQVLRVLSGVKPLTNESAPLRVFTTKNVSVVGSPSDNEKGYSTSYVNGYLKLWGLTSK
ncbi:sugar ABC transporter substrate-binding protein [Lysinimonas soli]|uniref:Sugar ABC transporter substrate-binding protein n=1 Tax=Lysinimonas soli TaxID=1074233 RepID=A0ABW0NPZ9_9MICO